MSAPRWTGDRVTPEAPRPAPRPPVVSTSVVHHGGRVTQKTTTTRWYDHDGRVIREEVVVEDCPLVVHPAHPWGPHWWQQSDGYWQGRPLQLFNGTNTAR